MNRKKHCFIKTNSINHVEVYTGSNVVYINAVVVYINADGIRRLYPHKLKILLPSLNNILSFPPYIRIIPYLKAHSRKVSKYEGPELQ